MVYARLLSIAAVTFLPICAFLLLLSLLEANGMSGSLADASFGLKTLYAVLWCSVAFGLLTHGRFVHRVAAGLEVATEKFDAWLISLPKRSTPIAIITLSACSLLLELVLIRWQSGLFSVFAFYKNFTLLACFCGLGIGYALANSKPLLLPLCLPALVLNVFVMLVFHYGGNDFTHMLFGLVPVSEEGSVSGVSIAKGSGLVGTLAASVPIYFLLVGAFLLNTLVTIPVAQLCGRVMRRLQPLPTYGLNLVGSVCGVLTLFVLSWLWIGPLVWFGLVAIILTWFLFAAGHGWRTGLACLALLVVILSWPAEPLIQNIYSPYQLIQKAAEPSGLMRILAGGTYYQKVFDLSFANPRRNSDSAIQQIAGYYELPFQTAEVRDSVAIVGAGSGNDVAAALRFNAGAIDAAEIDPVIRNLGRMFHPEHPYENPRVNSIIGDARAFFRNTNKNYDLIVYGVLDSHILVSHGSNVRLDSFVYTQEGLEDAYRHLKPGGLMSLAFALTSDLMGHKVYAMLRQLPQAGKPVAVLTSYDAKTTTTFMVRKAAEVALPAAFLKSHMLTDQTQFYAQAMQTKLDLPTDNWPFFYMDYKMYPASYVVSLALVMVLAAVLMRSFLPGRKWSAGMMPFFFLGSGFMLVETKAITELGLLFGNTWWVIGITIISVLVMGFLANVAVMKIRQRFLVVPFCLLLVTILLGFWIAHFGGLNTGGAAGKVFLTILLMSPLAFSGIVFSVLLEKEADVPSALAYNLSGAMLGGLLEYNSMEFGFSALYLIALALYACAWVTTRWRPQTV